MKILLVDNFWCRRVGSGLQVDISPHLGLMSLAAVLEAGGHEAAILDPKLLFRAGRFASAGADFRQAWADACEHSGADIVGFTAYGRTLPPVLDVARELRRRRPQLPILLGGPHATIMATPLMAAFDCLTAVVRHEAEPIIVALVESIGAGRPLTEIPNLVYREDGRIVETRRDPMLVDMDTLPYPALHLYPEAELRRIEMSLEAGRGCPFACTFCSTANFFQRRYRLKSNARLIDEMERARARYGVNVFNLNHDLFGLKKSSLREFCRLVEGRGFVWKCSMRSDTLDPSLLDELERAGCRDIYFGIETGSARLQAVVKKRLDLALTRETVAKVIAQGLQCTVSFITGFPDETEDDQDATLDLIGEFLAAGAPQLRAQLHTLSPEPGSELGDAAEGLRFDGVGPEADDIHDRDLIAAHPDIFSVFHHFPTALPRWRVVTASFLVMTLAPQMGIPFLNHLLSQHFDGRLSQFFHRLFPAPPDAPLQDHDAIVDALWSALERLVGELSADAPWLPDMLSLSKLLSSIRDAHVDAGASAGTEPGTPPVWLLHLSHPMSSLGAKTGLFGDRDELALPFTRSARTGGDGYWYLVHAAADGAINAHTLAETEARSLAREALAAPLKAASDFERSPYVRVA